MRPPIALPGADHQDVREGINDMASEVYQNSNIRYVDPNWTGVGARVGSVFAPYETIAAALADISTESSGNLYILMLSAGSHNGNFTIRPFIALVGPTTAKDCIITGNVASNNVEGFYTFKNVSVPNYNGLAVGGGSGVTIVSFVDAVVGKADTVVSIEGNGAGGTAVRLSRSILEGDFTLTNLAATMSGGMVKGNLTSEVTAIKTPDIFGSVGSLDMSVVDAPFLPSGKQVLLRNTHATAKMTANLHNVRMSKPLVANGAGAANILVRHDNVSLGNDPTFDVGVEVELHNGRAFRFDSVIINTAISTIDFVDVCELDITDAFVPGVYKLSASMVWSIDSTSDAFMFRLVDRTGAVISPTFHVESKDLDDIHTWNYPAVLTVQENTYYVKLQASIDNGGGGVEPATILAANLILQRKG